MSVHCACRQIGGFVLYKTSNLLVSMILFFNPFCFSVANKFKKYTVHEGKINMY